jgi:hypothetical protein
MGGGLSGHFELCVPCGDLGTADFTLNVLLFIPLGFGLRLAGMRRHWAWLAAFLLTATIEALQFYVVTGRESDLSDIVANSTGAALGIALADFRIRLFLPSPALARRLVAGWGLLCCTGAAGAQWALAPDLPHSIYYEQVAPDLGQFAVFRGIVYSATFDTARFRVGRLSADSSTAMRDALLAGGVTITASFQRADVPPRRLAPIVSVFDQHRREIFVLGQRVGDLAFRLRRRTDHLGFHPPSAILAHAFDAAQPSTDTLRAGVTVDRGSVLLELAGRDGATRRRIGFGPWDVWRLFIPDSGRFGIHETFWLLATMAALWLPLGYWAGRSAEEIAAPLYPAAALIALSITLAIIPWNAGSPPAPWPVWCMGAAGIAIGWTFSRLIKAWQLHANRKNERQRA